jgi:hypothetical protein
MGKAKGRRIGETYNAVAADASSQHTPEDARSIPSNPSPIPRDTGWAIAVV